MPLSPLQAWVYSNGQASAPESLVHSQITLKVPQAAGDHSIAPASKTQALQFAPVQWLVRVVLEGMGYRRAYFSTTLRVGPLVEHRKSHHCRQSWRAQGLVKLMLRNVHYLCSCLERALTRGPSILWGTSVFPHWHSRATAAAQKSTVTSHLSREVKMTRTANTVKKSWSSRIWKIHHLTVQCTDCYNRLSVDPVDPFLNWHLKTQTTQTQWRNRLS